ncbi:MAG: hypothetical protein ACI8O8_001621, partial [Oleiphilaceae bacterium]
MKTLITLISSTFIIFLLHGCSTPQTLQAPKAVIITEEQSPEELINQAASSVDTKERAKLLLIAAQKYYANKLITQSSAVTKDIDLDHLSPENTTKAFLLNLELAVYEDLEWHQKTSIEIFKKSSLNQINIDTLKVIIPLLAKTYKKQNLTILSAILLIEYAGIIDNTD